MVYKIILSLTLFVSYLGAITYEEIESQPRSLAKDFYIYRYLKQKETTEYEAWSLLGQAKRMNTKLLFAFDKKIKERGFNKDVGCMKVKKDAFLKADVDCKAIRISPSFALKLSKDEQHKVYKEISKVYPKKVEWLPILYAKQPFEKLLKLSPALFIQTFNAVSKEYRRKHFNKAIPLSTLTLLADHWSFKNLVNTVAMDKKLDKTARSLLFVKPDREKLHEHSAFYLGLIALRFDWKKKANKFFQRSESDAYYKMDKDKALFWQYLTTSDKTLLETLSQSFDLNVYSAYARELLHVDPYKTISPAPKRKNMRDYYSITDPFTWNYTLNFIKDMKKKTLKTFARTFYTQETLPQYAFLMEKASGYKENYFISPFDEYLNGMDLNKKILLLSLARQESRFIPASISTSYALGIMQFMPFLARAIAKDEKLKNFSLDDMFKPQTAYKFADIHLDFLNKSLYHPLFVAYAYNGGIGFTKRLLTRGDLFNKGKYEPFMSMELIPYAESRKYGKKVLANYVTYARIYGKEANLKTLFQNLSSPSQTDRFRH